jgi:DNA topoisomerase I
MPDPDAIHVLAGDCRVRADGITHRGEVVVLIKPDNTVLVHDVDGYQPVAWLTRADSVAHASNGGFSVVATAGERTLRVESRSAYGFGRYPGSCAGIPVGDCPDCSRVLVRAGGRVSCPGCSAEYGLPDGASVLDSTCECGLPRMRVARGATFELCIDRACESLDDAVRDSFDGAWNCPDYGGALRVIRRGGLLAGCENYPDCEVGYVIPDGVTDDDCPCGLPVFETPRGRRCLDATCGAVDR